MKQIIENCKSVGEKLSKGFNTKIRDHDLAKLRLRGKGSGFKEGAKNEEISEALHLCVSSKYRETYNKA